MISPGSFRFVASPTVSAIGRSNFATSTSVLPRSQMVRGRDDIVDRSEVKSDRDPDRAEVREQRTKVAEVLGRRLALPRGPRRERVQGSHRDYALCGAQTRALATIGVFRAVAERDLQDSSPDDIRSVDLRHLKDQGLVMSETIADASGTTRVLTLTSDGWNLLERHREPGLDGREQSYYAGVANARALGHDSQLYRMFIAEADRIIAEGGRVTRVVLGQELHRDYQAFLRRNDSSRGDIGTERQTFADANDLHVHRGQLEIPDIRLEYETADGRLDYRDVELLTEHYSRGQMAGKVSAGFVCYRASGDHSGTPAGPRRLRRL